MKCKRILVVLFVYFALGAGAVFAHSGGTDAQGGHHDYKNVSGLGSYHYHHGYPAHLHPNGICPYETNAAEARTPAPTEPAWEQPRAEALPPRSIQVIVDGEERISDPAPQMIGERILIPALCVSDYFGVQVTWDMTANRITCTKGSVVVVVAAGETACLINGVSGQMEQPPVIKGGCFFLPAREIAERFGYQTVWNPETQTLEFLKKDIKPEEYLV